MSRNEASFISRRSESSMTDYGPRTRSEDLASESGTEEQALFSLPIPAFHFKEITCKLHQEYNLYVVVSSRNARIVMGPQRLNEGEWEELGKTITDQKTPDHERSLGWSAGTPPVEFKNTRIHLPFHFAQRQELRFQLYDEFDLAVYQGHLLGEVHTTAGRCALHGDEGFEMAVHNGRDEIGTLMVKTELATLYKDETLAASALSAGSPGKPAELGSPILSARGRAHSTASSGLGGDPGAAAAAPALVPPWFASAALPYHRWLETADRRHVQMKDCVRFNVKLTGLKGKKGHTLRPYIVVRKYTKKYPEWSARLCEHLHSTPPAAAAKEEEGRKKAAGFEFLVDLRRLLPRRRRDRAAAAADPATAWAKAEAKRKEKTKLPSPSAVAALAKEQSDKQKTEIYSMALWGGKMEELKERSAAGGKFMDSINQNNRSSSNNNQADEEDLPPGIDCTVLVQVFHKSSKKYGDKFIGATLVALHELRTASSEVALRARLHREAPPEEKDTEGGKQLEDQEIKSYGTIIVECCRDQMEEEQRVQLEKDPRRLRRMYADYVRRTLRGELPALREAALAERRRREQAAGLLEAIYGRVELVTSVYMDLSTRNLAYDPAACEESNDKGKSAIDNLHATCELNPYLNFTKAFLEVMLSYSISVHDTQIFCFGIEEKDVRKHAKVKHRTRKEEEDARIREQAEMVAKLGAKARNLGRKKDRASANPETKDHHHRQTSHRHLLSKQSKQASVAIMKRSGLEFNPEEELRGGQSAAGLIESVTKCGTKTTALTKYQKRRDSWVQVDQSFNNVFIGQPHEYDKFGESYHQLIDSRVGSDASDVSDNQAKSRRNRQRRNRSASSSSYTSSGSSSNSSMDSFQSRSTLESSGSSSSASSHGVQLPPPPPPGGVGGLLLGDLVGDVDRWLRDRQRASPGVDAVVARLERLSNWMYGAPASAPNCKPPREQDTQKAHKRRLSTRSTRSQSRTGRDQNRGFSGFASSLGNGRSKSHEPTIQPRRSTSKSSSSRQGGDFRKQSRNKEDKPSRRPSENLSSRGLFGNMFNFGSASKSAAEHQHPSFEVKDVEYRICPEALEIETDAHLDGSRDKKRKKNKKDGCLDGVQGFLTAYWKIWKHRQPAHPCAPVLWKGTHNHTMMNILRGGMDSSSRPQLEGLEEATAPWDYRRVTAEEARGAGLGPRPHGSGRPQLLDLLRHAQSQHLVDPGRYSVVVLETASDLEVDVDRVRAWLRAHEEVAFTIIIVGMLGMGEQFVQLRRGLQELKPEVADGGMTSRKGRYKKKDLLAEAAKRVHFMVAYTIQHFQLVAHVGMPLNVHMSRAVLLGWEFTDEDVDLILEHIGLPKDTRKIDSVAKCEDFLHEVSSVLLDRSLRVALGFVRRDLVHHLGDPRRLAALTRHSGLRGHGGRRVRIPHLLLL